MVFTNKNVVLVYLEERIQKDLSYNLVVEHVDFGLNMMTSGPNFIIIAKVDEDNQSVLQKTRQMEAIGEGPNTFLLTNLSYDSE